MAAVAHMLASTTEAPGAIAQGPGREGALRKAAEASLVFSEILSSVATATNFAAKTEGPAAPRERAAAEFNESRGHATRETTPSPERETKTEHLEARTARREQAERAERNEASPRSATQRSTENEGSEKTERTGKPDSEGGQKKGDGNSGDVRHREIRGPDDPRSQEPARRGDGARATDKSAAAEARGDGKAQVKTARAESPEAERSLISRIADRSPEKSGPAEAQVKTARAASPEAKHNSTSNIAFRATDKGGASAEQGDNQAQVKIARAVSSEAERNLISRITDRSPEKSGPTEAQVKISRAVSSGAERNLASRIEVRGAGRENSIARFADQVIKAEAGAATERACGSHAHGRAENGDETRIAPSKTAAAAAGEKGEFKAFSEARSPETQSSPRAPAGSAVQRPDPPAPSQHDPGGGQSDTSENKSNQDGAAQQKQGSPAVWANHLASATQQREAGGKADAEFARRTFQAAAAARGPAPQGSQPGGAANAPASGIAVAAQNLTATSAKALAAPGAPATPEQPDKVMQQVIRAAKLTISQGREEMRLLLKPEHLGMMKIRISVEGKDVTARIEVESESTRELIKSNVQALQQALQAQNLKVANITVDVQGDGRSLLRGDRDGRHSGRRGFAGSALSGDAKAPEAGIPIDPGAEIRLTDGRSVDVRV